MKTFICSLSLLLAALGLSAQITLGGSDLPTPGYRAYLSTPDTLFSVDPAPTGPGFDWDFRGMTAIAQRRDSFISLNQVPFAIRLFFSGSSVVRYQETPDSLAGFSLSGGYEFFDVESGAYTRMGLGGTLSGLPVAFVYNPRDTLFRLPLSYGMADSSSAQATLDVPGLLYVTQTVNRTWTVDGWGTLQTPYGSFSVLRLATTLTGYDSVSLDTIQFGLPRPAQVVYEWRGQEEAVPLLSITTTLLDTFSVTSGIAYVDSQRSFSTTPLRAPIAPAALHLAPNPARDRVSLSLDRHLGPDASLRLYDLQGRLWREQAFTAGQSLDLSGLPAGVYTVEVRAHDRWYRGRLVLER